VYYGDAGVAAPAQMDRIYPAFLWRELPPGLAGLSVAAILAAAMANLSAALNALASTSVVDFMHGAGLKQARKATIAWAAVLLGIGIASRHSHSVLEAGLTIASIPFGALLGVFLLGILTQAPRETAAIAGMLAGLAAVLAVHWLTPVAWTWYVLIGTVVTFSSGYAAAQFQARAEGENK
jgi:Na+/proline symporter